MRVLLIDDDASTRGLFETVLGFTDDDITTVETEGDALSYLNNNQPDVIVLDIMLPKKDGYNVLQTLRQRLPKCPIIATTAYYTSGDDPQKFIKKGFDGYLPKPIYPDKLLPFLVEAINSHKT